MVCALCGNRKAKRACPALGRSICARCCGAKRLTEIPCPADCPYLAASHEHPAAAVLKHDQADLARLLDSVRDLNTGQSQLFLRIATALAGYRPEGFSSLIDEDVAEATGSLASTFETAARGVIYDHQPASLPAARLSAALKTVVVEAGGHGGTAFERDAAVVLRRVESAARAFQAAGRKRDGFLDVVRRVTAG